MARQYPSKRATGARYEETAVDFLRQMGYEILERNYRDRLGEIDIVAEEGGYLVFVEVKYRKDAGNGYPEEAVSVPKQKSEETPCRFDVVSILGQEITLIRDAF